MTRVLSAAWLPFRLPYAALFTTSRSAESAREGVLLRLAADDGLEGLGEASPVTAFGAGTAADALQAIVALAPQLAGATLDQAETLLSTLDITAPGLAAVACALDTALCDLRARAAGVSVATLLGPLPAGACAPGYAVPVNATIGAAAVEAASEAARRAVADGFRCVKLKVGMAGALADELARIAAVRAAIGPDVQLRLDANGAWDVETAITLIHAAARYDLALVEQPTPADDLDALAQVRAAVTTPIAADEPVRGPREAQRVIAADAADALIVKPMLAGGLRPARAVLALARAAGLRAIVTTTIDAGVGAAAALHLAATLPSPPPACGLATGSLLVADLLARPLAYAHGALLLPAGPGLGITLDEQQLARYGQGWRGS